MLGNRPLGSAPLAGSIASGSSANVSASQTLDALTQTASVGVLDQVSASQTLDALSQSASVGAIDTVTAAQTLPALSQTATVGVVDQVSAAQTLADLSQSASVGVTDTVSAAQTLDALAPTASVGAVDTLSAAQTLGPLAQSASISLPTSTPQVDASQTLAALLQTADIEVPRIGGGPALRERRLVGAPTADELRARRFAEIIREVEEAEGLRKPAAEAQHGDEALSGTETAESLDSASKGVKKASSDAFQDALLSKLLALPDEAIRLPVQPFPHVISKGRAAAIEAARLHAIRLRDDDEAMAALVTASLF